MSEPRDRRQPPEFEIPDLELPPPRASQSGMHAVRAGAAERSSPAPSANSDVHGSTASSVGPTLDLGDPDFDAAAIQLEHEAEISQTGVLLHYGRSAGLAEDDFEPAVTEALRRSVPVLDTGSNWPTGATPARERLILDANEVRALADFGDPPTFALLAPVYSLRVFFRRKAMMAALEIIDRDIVAAETERDRLVSALAERLRPVLAGDATWQRLVNGKAGQSSVELGRAILGARGAIELDSRTIEAVRQADERVRSLVSKSEVHLRALDVCDETTVRLGFTCIAVVVVAALGFAVWQLR